MAFVTGAAVGYRWDEAAPTTCVVGAFVCYEGNAAVVAVAPGADQPAVEVTAQGGTSKVAVVFASVDRDSVFAARDLPAGLTASSRLSPWPCPRALGRAFFTEGVSSESATALRPPAARPRAPMKVPLPPEPANLKVSWDQLLGQMRHGRATGDAPSSDDEDAEIGPIWDLAQPRDTTGRPPKASSSWGLSLGPSAGPTGTGGAAAGGVDVNLALQLEVLKVLRRLQKKGGDSDSGAEDETHTGLRVHRAGVEALAKLRKQLKKNPDKVTAAHVLMMKDRLGVTDARMIWHPTDYSRRLLPKFGRMRGMWRVHYMTSELLAALLQKRVAEATALVCQLQKVLLQLVLDGGDWSSAMLLWPSHDPLGSEDFGGSVTEMAAVHKYKKAVAELKSRFRSSAQDDEEDEPSEGKTGKPKGNPKKGGGRGGGSEAK